MTPSLSALREKAHGIRRTTLELCIHAGKGHLSSCLSCTDMLVALYHGGGMRHDPGNPDWEQRDRFVLSKGQASPVLYAILADLGYFDPRELQYFAKPNGIFGVHLQMDVPGVEITAGSLGQGFGTAAGMALAAKMNRENHLTYALLGDGELYEGSIWETAMFVAHNRLNNLVTLVDRNFQCVTDFTENILALESIEAKFSAFGFNTIRLDGHSMEALVSALIPLRNRPRSRPTVIIADTVKGAGVKTICHDPLWHGVAPQGKTADQCLMDLEENHGH